eukprot:5756231-Pyramimonas_sp.AAC.1
MSMLDGFIPVVVRQRGHSIVVCTFYGHHSQGYSGQNLERLSKLGALLQALHLPWVVLGDFNMSSLTLSPGGFLGKIG